MHALDWTVIGFYLVGVLGLGLSLARRAGQSSESYLVAGRRLRWWVIGTSDVASDAGGDAYWILVIFTAAFMGMYRVWWISSAVALPLAIIWARYWRRLALLSPWEIFEVRYGGKAAGVFRGFSAVYAATVTSVVVLAYVLKAFSQIMAPFLGWSVDTVLIVFGGVSVLYTAMSGLVGVSYSDVPQFILLMLGRIALAVMVVGAAGGLGHVLDQVEVIRGAAFLQPYPPSPPGVPGQFAVEPMTMVALFIVGMFKVAGTQSAGVQRSLAAISEREAALGQVFNALLSLVVRVAPLGVIGLSAVVLYEGVDIKAADIWADMVQTHAFPGLLGLILVGVVAGYMSTIDTFLNLLTSGLFNDFYRRHLRPEATEREQVLFCRASTVLVTAIAVFWAYVLIAEIDGAWLNFINSVIGLFILPLGLLRWVWWRLNIWGELVGYVLGVPLAYLVWFQLGFKDAPYWQSFLLLFGLGWASIVAVTLLTPAEDEAVLQRFYKRVRPLGFWGPVARSLSAHERADVAAEIRFDVISAFSGLVFCLAMIVSLATLFARQWGLLGVACGVMICAGYGFYWAMQRAESVRDAMKEGSDERPASA